MSAASGDLASAAAPLTVAGVLRAALALLRRHAILYASLAVALSVLPDLLGDAAADALRTALHIPETGTTGDDARDLPAALVDALAAVLPILGGLVLDVAVVVIALGGRARSRTAASGGPSIALRVLPLATASSVIALTWASWAPSAALVPGSALISLWILVVPVAAAEAVRPSALPGRSWDLTRGSRWLLVRLVAAYAVLYVVLGEVELDLPPPFEDGTAAAWAVDSVEASLVAALAVLADVTAVALYAALLRREMAGQSSALSAAFD